MIKIIDGTRNTKHLCSSCDNAVSIKAMPETGDFQYCMRLAGRIRTHVVDCTCFARRSERLNDIKMIEQAVLIDLDFHGNPKFTRHGKRYAPTAVSKKRRVVATSPRNSVVRPN